MDLRDLPTFRSYGSPPYHVALIHGGPGAPGTMSLLAENLSSQVSVLEPLQTAMSIDGLMDELRKVLEEEADLPVSLVGSSWGAMFAFMFAAVHSSFVRRLILIGSGPFEASYAEQIRHTRLGRLPSDKRHRAEEVLASLESLSPGEMQQPLLELFHLYNEADAYDPITLDTGLIGIYVDQHLAVWEEALEIRASGQLLQMAERIECPVIAIHGEQDPHPPEGVREPLSGRLKYFEFILLENCGHMPVIERQAREKFLEVLLQEIQ